MPITNVRLDVVRWLVTNLRTALTSVQVEPGWPGDNLKRETLWVDEVEGSQILPVMVAGRRQRDDQFTVPLEIRVVAGSLDEAADRLSAIVAGVENVMADAHTLDDEVDGIVSAEISDERTLCARAPDGPKGFARIELAFHARLT